jgi:hypothetical protein
MTNFNAPLRRASGEPDVFTALLAAAALVLVIGVVALALANTRHSDVNNAGGGPLTLVP